MNAVRAVWRATDKLTRAALLVAIALIISVPVIHVAVGIDYSVAANVSLIVATALVSVFTIMYSFRSHWWSNRLGRVYWGKCVLMSLMLIQITMAIWWDADYPGFVIYSATGIAYVAMISALRREQERGPWS